MKCGSAATLKRSPTPTHTRMATLNEKGLLSRPYGNPASKEWQPAFLPIKIAIWEAINKVNYLISGVERHFEAPVAQFEGFHVEFSQLAGHFLEEIGSGDFCLLRKTRIRQFVSKNFLSFQFFAKKINFVERSWTKNVIASSISKRAEQKMAGKNLFCSFSSRVFSRKALLLTTARERTIVIKWTFSFVVLKMLRKTSFPSVNICFVRVEITHLACTFDARFPRQLNQAVEECANFSRPLESLLEKLFPTRKKNVHNLMSHMRLRSRWSPPLEIHPTCHISNAFPSL